MRLDLKLRYFSIAAGVVSLLVLLSCNRGFASASPMRVTSTSYATFKKIVNKSHDDKIGLDRLCLDYQQPPLRSDLWILKEDPMRQNCITRVLVNTIIKLLIKQQTAKFIHYKIFTMGYWHIDDLQV